MAHKKEITTFNKKTYKQYVGRYLFFDVCKHTPRQFADKIKSAVSHSGRPLPFFDNVYYVVLPLPVDLPGCTV